MIRDMYGSVTLSLALSFGLSCTCFTQNLVPNPSFEIYTECPSVPGQIELAFPWVDGGNGNSDYFHVCASPGDYGVPSNEHGSQWPVSGQGYAGVFTRQPNNHDYIRAPLHVPLNSGSAYLVSFYISLADNWCAIQPFGALLTIDPPIPDANENLPYVPQIEVNGGFLDDSEGWIHISRCFIAEGGEEYITIGNFRSNEDTPPHPDCGGGFNTSYYYVDSIIVMEMPHSEEGFVLDPVEACPPYTIFPGSAENYQWSDGTTNPTLTVTESGIYYVTLSNACAFSYGEIEVTILPDAPPVELPNDTILCTAESLSISLDPDAGAYVWEDGTIGPDLTISTEGVYIVTLTDDCDMTEDTIQVDFLDTPAFSLGADTAICNGDAFTISLDPDLGDFEWQDGSNSSSFTIEDDGTYALTISNICGQSEDEITVDFVQPIVVDIGPDQMTLCDGEEITIEIDPSLGDFLWHDDSDGNSFTISEAGTVSVTVSNACYTETDEMLVDVLYQPVFTLGPDITVCSGQFPITLDMSGVQHAQAWEWTGGSTTSIYQITAPGTYSVTISNDCFAMSDEIVVSVGDVDPIVTLPVDQLLCEGQTYVLDAGDLMGNYQWQDFSSADTFLVTQAGTYSLTVTNVCGSGADTVVIDYMQDLAPPDLGPDFSLCPGETGVLYAGVENVSYQWVDVSTGSTSDADSLIITGPGMYALQISDACSSASDTITVTTDANPPDVDLPASLDLCQGDTIVIDAGITGVNYLWQDGSVASQYVAILSGVYHLQVSNACGTDTDTIVIIDAGLAPYVELGDDVEICTGEEYILNPVSSAVESWSWYDSTGLVSTDTVYNIIGAGSVYVEVANACGTDTDTIQVTLLPALPSLDLGEDLALCPGETATLTINEPDVVITWYDVSTGAASTGSTTAVDSATTIIAQITNACGSSSDTISIDLLPGIPDLDLGADQSLCPGETIILDPGIQDVDYIWLEVSSGVISTGSTTAVTVTGMIILTISNACGSSTDTVEIIADTDGPQVDLGEDILACEGDSVILDAGISGVEYLWQDGTIASHFIATQSGVYHLTVSNACGSDADTIIVDIHGTIPTPSLGPDTTLCDDEVLILTSDVDAGTEIVWHVSDSVVSTDVELIIRRSGIYSLTETNHCGAASDTIVVVYQSAPIAFDLGEDVVLCPGDSIILIAPATTDVITWQDGSHGASFIADQEQVYSLQISNDCGVSNDEVVVSFDQDVPVVDLEPSLSICPDQSVTLDVTQAINASYLWNTGSTMPSIVITQPDMYAVTVSTDCYSVLDDIVIEQSDDCVSGIYIPNVFSPNGDGVNDEWVVYINDPNVIGIECRVFDRWGDVVFEDISAPISWSGDFKGKGMMPGVYVYIVTLENRNGERTILSGDVTLIR